MINNIKISPSMMCANPLKLRDTLDVFAQGKVEWLHMDVMDGHYVPNFTLGPDLCRWIARASHIPLDIHLMVEDPARCVEWFLDFPGARITIHPEVAHQPLRILQRIRDAGLSPGIAIDPALPIESLRHLIPEVDQIMVMTVNPGYAGQKLVPFCIDKLRETRQLLHSLGHDADISVDGNVSWENIPRMVEAGANILVAGTSSLFKDGAVLPADLVRFRNAALPYSRASA